MSAQPTAPPTTRRDQVLHWLLWSCELAMAALVVPFLVMMTVIMMPSWDLIVSSGPATWYAELVLTVTALALSGIPGALLLWWLIRGVRYPFGPNRLQRGAAAVTVLTLIATFMITLPDLESHVDLAATLATLIGWAFYRLLFLGLLAWTGVEDNRPAEERMRQARIFIGILAYLMFMTGFEWTRSAEAELSAWLYLAIFVAPFFFYRITADLTAWRLRRKLAAAPSPPAAGEGGAA